mmetsp:Transcript_3587/g.6788  ORF Transcript_3587/g.6788 Transcript_3587/m.6788 type:complete len:197 (-) Transcript_3587:83-673(-)|eukprot:CAMPEP_0182452922 /NCGR_PEP_ID=MMETSP1319-20130603/207_1 /TAXON_ID=172717 /ORGANISM="Bolidomonas pacifica, Strain RCC208" /LENGTH=196 /DNA_ID=CAMNT_0024650805 /DNA_START=234 /DNA_END=824 /DNA_ORIENTATION=-
MFLPSSAASRSGEEERRRQAYSKVEGYIMERIPAECRSEAQVVVQEVQCGDPSCSPIDTGITVLFNSGGRGMFGVPVAPADFEAEDLDEFCPPGEIFAEWFKGNNVEWYPNPVDDDAYEANMQEMLRFQIGTLVQCRIAADPVTGWANGQVVELFYRESNWPPGQVAPYKIQLDDGRKIFAPQDTPEVVRARPHPG